MRVKISHVSAKNFCLRAISLCKRRALPDTYLSAASLAVFFAHFRNQKQNRQQTFCWGVVEEEGMNILDDFSFLIIKPVACILLIHHQNFSI
jgi:hypothetical protein